jgi:hypothetical protein
MSADDGFKVAMLGALERQAVIASLRGQSWAAARARRQRLGIGTQSERDAIGAREEAARAFAACLVQRIVDFESGFLD